MLVVVGITRIYAFMSSQAEFMYNFVRLEEIQAELDPKNALITSRALNSR